jgi:hypothetical protein
MPLHFFRARCFYRLGYLLLYNTPNVQEEGFE